jgi:O-antigen/teichoic acid export membrane protein
MQRPWTRFLPDFIKRRIEASPQLRDILSNTGWLLGDRIVRAVVGLLVNVWMASYLGPALYGKFSYAFAFSMLFVPAAMLGLDQIAMREMVKDPEKKDDVLGTVFFLMLLGGLAVFILANTSIRFIAPQDSLTYWLVAIMTAGAVFQSFYVIDFWFESKLQWKFSVYAKNTAFLFLSLVKIGLIFIKAPLIAFAWAGLAEIAIGSAGLVLVFRTRGYSLRTWRYSRKMAATFLKDGWPQLFSVFLAMIHLKVDQVMLGNMAGNEQVGYYSIAVRLADAGYFIPLAICYSVFPSVVEAKKMNEALYYDRMQRLYNLIVLLSYAIAIPVMFLSDRIVEILFSSAYRSSGPLLAVFIWTGLFSSLSAGRNVFMVSQNWLRINLVSTFLACLLNIVLNYYLIPGYGAMGAIVASLISYWFAVHGSCFIFRPLRTTGWMLTKAMLYPKIW